MICVNGIAIGKDAIAREMQHHLADSREQAERYAATALVLREVLLQRACDRDIAGASEDDRIANLIDDEVRVPEPTLDEVARYYRRNTLRFLTPARYEAAHIFFPLRNGADETEVKSCAERVLGELARQPHRFAEFALAYSACSSKDEGGSLGQVSKGDTNLELEQALATMEVGSIRLVRSRHGFHILRLDGRIPGTQLTLEQATSWIEDHLRKSCKYRAVAQYLQLLTSSAKISGIDLAAADSPLVQ